MNSKVKIAVFTAARSEYGLLLPLLHLLKKAENIDLRLLVGGAHLLKEFGNTQEEIDKDGLSADAFFPYLSDVNNETSLLEGQAKLTVQLSEYFKKCPPDCLVILGDRFELLAVASVCLLLNIPIAHISGGDVTEGSIDNQVRNAVSKMASIHFPATISSEENLLKMGEEKWRICVSGEPGLDLIQQLTLIKKEELYSKLSLNTNKQTVLCTFHTETIANEITEEFLQHLFSELVKINNQQYLVTAAGADAGGTVINNFFRKFSQQYSNVFFVESLGQLWYFSLLKYADLLLGNSSSALVEAQSFALPAVNVGKRQQGRLANINVVNSAANVDAVLTAIKQAQESNFVQGLKGKQNVYGDGNACRKILAVLEQLPDRNKLLLKK